TTSLFAFSHTLVWILALQANTAAADSDTSSRTRTFSFTYAATVTGLAPNKTASVWLPFPPSNEEQQVKVVAKQLPVKEQLGREKKYGNEVVFFQSKPKADGSLAFSITYRVKRREVRADLDKAGEETEARSLFLRPDALVPITGKPLELIKGTKVPG